MWTLFDAVMEGGKVEGGTINEALNYHWTLDNSLGELVIHDDFRPKAGESAANFIADNPSGSGYSFICHSYIGFQTINNPIFNNYDYSVSFWAKGTKVASAGGSYFTNIGIISGIAGFAFQYEPDSSTQQIKTESGSVNTTITGYDKTVWNHVVFTVQINPIGLSTLKLYLNNSLISTQNISISIKDYPLTLNDDCYCDMKLSHLRIYGKVLGAGEISTLYNDKN
jgi:hypothetical protein